MTTLSTEPSCTLTTMPLAGLMPVILLKFVIVNSKPGCCKLGSNARFPIPAVMRAAETGHQVVVASPEPPVRRIVRDVESIETRYRLATLLPEMPATITGVGRFMGL